MRYRKKPIEVDAFVYTGAGPEHEGHNVAALQEFMGEQHECDLIRPGNRGDHQWAEPLWPLGIWIAKSQAWGHIEAGGAVIAEADGTGFYPCHRSTFEATYEEVPPIDPAAGLKA